MRVRGVWGAVVLCAMLGAGCGHTLHRGRNPVVRVSVAEYRLRPDAITAPAGTVTLVAHNIGQLTHNLAVTGSSSQVLAATRPIPPGATATLVVRLPRGTYTLASTIQSDEALGDHGTLRITR